MPVNINSASLRFRLSRFLSRFYGEDLRVAWYFARASICALVDLKRVPSNVGLLFKNSRRFHGISWMVHGKGYM